MLLGKRPRPPMKRTTSMTEITLDLNTNSDGAPPPLLMISDSTTHQNNPQRQPTNASCGGGGATASQSQQRRGGGGGGFDGLNQQFLQPTTMVSSRDHRRNSADFVDTAHFLRACSLCKRRLFPGRDIYMYRYNYYGFLFPSESFVFIKFLPFVFFWGFCPQNISGVISYMRLR